MNNAASELAALTQALRSHLKRSQASGLRRLGKGPSGSPRLPQTEADATGGGAPRPPAVEDSRPDSGTPSTATPELQAAKAANCLTLEQLEAAVASCTACSLCQTRTQTVFADGNAGQEGIFFVGEAPGEEEDRTGTPFVGPAGKLLTDIIVKGMGLSRQQVTIANVLKCRPPGNRDPKPEETALCTPFLQRQIELLDPKVLIPLGRHASNHLLGTKGSMGSLRNQVHEKLGRKIVPTYHPAYLLREPARKRDCWSDIQLAMAAAELGEKPG